MPVSVFLRQVRPEEADNGDAVRLRSLSYRIDAVSAEVRSVGDQFMSTEQVGRRTRVFRCDKLTVVDTSRSLNER